MKDAIQSICPFIGAKDYELSRQFYRDFGFEEISVAPNMSYFRMGGFGFYLQEYFVKDWVDNSMVFLEVTNLKKQLALMKAKNLEAVHPRIRITEIHYNDWGNEFFIYDPSGILWHIGEFNS